MRIFTRRSSEASSHEGVLGVAVGALHHLLVGDHRLLGAGALRLGVLQKAGDVEHRLVEVGAQRPVVGGRGLLLGGQNQRNQLDEGDAGRDLLGDPQRRDEGQVREQFVLGERGADGGRAHLLVGLAHVRPALQQLARHRLGQRRRVGHVGGQRQVLDWLVPAPDQDQQRALGGMLLGLKAVHARLSAREVARDMVRVGAGSKTVLELGLGGVQQLGFDFQLLLGVLDLNRQAARHEVLVGNVGHQGRVGGLDIEPGRRVVGLHGFAVLGERAHEVDFPTRLEVGVQCFR